MLLADRATEGLTEAEARELDRLLADHPEIDAQCMDRAAAAADLALTGPPGDLEPLPRQLRERIEAAALGQLGASLTATARMAAGGAAAAEPAVKAHQAHDTSKPRVQHRRRAIRLPRPLREPAYAGWATAAAATAVAIVAWWPVGWGGGGGWFRGDAPSRARDVLLARPTVVRLEWSDPSAATEPRGDVVFDPEAQTGAMRFVDCLPANDAAIEQYQLWIVDAARDERYPVDGGVFDVPAGRAETIISFQPRLHVHEPVAFIITIERPGGVVVSDRSRVALVAER